MFASKSRRLTLQEHPHNQPQPDNYTHTQSENERDWKRYPRVVRRGLAEVKSILQEFQPIDRVKDSTVKAEYKRLIRVCDGDNLGGTAAAAEELLRVLKAELKDFKALCAKEQTTIIATIRDNNGDAMY
ncbi:hypothetical protein LTR15_004613 [Elasticomyces elasticus]|nr:hypothetical protein LTR15_004613 [Elasticomyces elasticus]